MSKTDKRIPLADAMDLANDVIAIITPICSRVEVVGSVRRLKPDIGDIDILTIPNDKLELDSKVKEISEVQSGLGGNWQIITTFHGHKINILKTNQDSWGASVMHSTGSQEFNVALRAMAKRKGLKLSQWGLRTHDNVILAGKTEESVFNAMGIRYLNPQDRKGFTSVRLMSDPGYKEFLVKSRSSDNWYFVIQDQCDWSCECMANSIGGKLCHHISSASDWSEDNAQIKRIK